MEIQYRRDLWKITPSGDAAEIGVAEGLFAVDLLNMPGNFPQVYLVDRWRNVSTQRGDASHPQYWHDKNYQEVIQRVAEFGSRAVLLRGDSVEMAKQVPDHSLALVNVDADHSYEGCLADSHAWVSKLVPGGIMAFHDYQNPSYGVYRAVNCFARFLGVDVHDIPENSKNDAGAWICLQERQ